MAMAAVALAPLVVVVVVLSSASSFVAARDFYIGGRDGWTDKPAERYNSWAERNRFQINDRLVFRYGKGDSVLVVSLSHYDACNTTAPLLRLEGGNSVFVLGKSGPFFFIGGDAARCQAGERVIVVVLADRSSGITPSPPPASSQPPPTSSSPPSPPVPSPAPLSLPPPPPAAGCSSSPSPSLAPAPAPALETNGTASPPPPSPSSASVLRGGALLSFIMGGAIILV